MLSAEWVIICLNTLVLCAAYFFVYPRFAGADMHRLLVNDLLANACALTVAGMLYFGTGQRFVLLFFELGWFGFTLLTFLLLELPFFVAYARRYGLFDKLADDDR